MTRFPIGLTYPPDERKRLYLDQTTCLKNGSGVVKSHQCEVTLANGLSCVIEYRRNGPTAHAFSFGPPIDKTIWSSTRLDGTIEDIEREAAGCAVSAFLMAQDTERTLMRRKTKPNGEANVVFGDLPAKTADACAGNYAVCVKLESGSLLRVGNPFDRPELATEDLYSDGHRKYQVAVGQELVVGICNRWARRWQEPKFLERRLLLEPATQQLNSDLTPAAEEKANVAPAKPNRAAPTRSRSRKPAV